MNNTDETKTGPAHSEIKVSREYSVEVPKDEGAYLVVKSDWNRIKRMVSGIVPAKDWFEVSGSICIGIAVAAIFSLIGFSASKDVPSWAVFVDWCALVCGVILAAALFCLRGEQKVYATHRAIDITQEMDRIEELCKTSLPATSSIVTPKELAGRVSLERLVEIRFDHAGSPLDQWKFTSDDPKSTSPPRFSSPTERTGGLTMVAPGTHHIDLRVEPQHRLCNRLRFQTKPGKDCPESYIYANVQVTSKDGKHGPMPAWIACNIGMGPPARHGPNEWIIYRTPAADGWATFDLLLPEEVQSSPLGREDGLAFSELLGIRMRGSISVSPIELWRDNREQGQ